MRELREAARLPIPIAVPDTFYIGIQIEEVPPGYSVTLPETVYVFQEPRIEREKSFPLIEATIDSARVRLLGADRDCVFTAPAKGETLAIVADSTGCKGFVSGIPTATTIKVPMSQVTQKKGFIAQVTDLLSKVFVAILLLLGGAAALQVFRMYQSR